MAVEREGGMVMIARWAVELTKAEVQALANGVSPMLIRPESLLEYNNLLSEPIPSAEKRQEVL